MGLVAGEGASPKLVVLVAGVYVLCFPAVAVEALVSHLDHALDFVGVSDDVRVTEGLRVVSEVLGFRVEIHCCRVYLATDHSIVVSV